MRSGEPCVAPDWKIRRTNRLFVKRCRVCKQTQFVVRGQLGWRERVHA